MPRQLNFRRAAVVSAVIGFVILPWNLYKSPIAIICFLGGLGAFLGPLFGIVMADYWLIRKQHVDVPALYGGRDGESIAMQARKVAAPETEIVALTPRFGAEPVEGNSESYHAAGGVMDAVMRYDQPFEAVIQAGCGGMAELEAKVRARTGVPVVDGVAAAVTIA